MAQVANGTGGLGRIFAVGAAVVSVIAPIVLGSIWISNVSGNATMALARLEEIDTRLSRLLDSENRGDIDMAQVRSALTEIETQFKASDQIRNVMHADDMRWRSVIWQKVFPGTTMPTDNAYYPTISGKPEK